jgi:hypothetical protein
MHYCRVGTLSLPLILSLLVPPSVRELMEMTLTQLLIVSRKLLFQPGTRSSPGKRGFGRIRNARRGPPSKTGPAEEQTTGDSKRGRGRKIQLP